MNWIYQNCMGILSKCAQFLNIAENLAHFLTFEFTAILKGFKKAVCKLFFDVFSIVSHNLSSNNYQMYYFIMCNQFLWLEWRKAQIYKQTKFKLPFNSPSRHMPQWRNRLAHGTYKTVVVSNAGVVSSSLTWGIFFFSQVYYFSTLP